MTINITSIQLNKRPYYRLWVSADNRNRSVATYTHCLLFCTPGVSGWQEPRLINEIVHNRTVNLKGGLGHNIAMDRVVEFLNAEFKGQY